MKYCAKIGRSRVPFSYNLPAVQSTQPVTEISTRKIFLEVKVAGA